MTTGSRPSFASRHPVWTTLGALFVLGLVIEYWWVIVLAAACVAAIYGITTMHKRSELRAAAQAQAAAAIAARADFEHRRYLAGDPTGVYGQYPPARG